MGQVEVDQKSNEITAIPKLLEVLDLHGAVQGATAAPSQGQSRTLALLEERMRGAVEDLNRVIRRGGPSRAGAPWPKPTPMQ